MNGQKIGTLADVAEDMSRGVFDFTDNGKCVNCGACCSDMLPLSDVEIKRLRRFVKSSGYKGHRNAVVQIDLTCPFRNNEKMVCDVYKIRPAICRDFKCDKPAKGEWANSELYSRDTRIVSVRHEVFDEG